MGYELHIVRPDQSKYGDMISATDWCALVEADSELTFTSPSDPDRAEENGLEITAEWTPDAEELPVVFAWRRGRIAANTPDSMGLMKMTELAQVLHARVEGPDGEIYHSDGTITRQ